MTFPPEKIGDKGQRYEIRAYTSRGRIFTVGYSPTPDGFKEVIEVHPDWRGHHAIDRGEKKDEG